jgi:hypothetical protein
VEVPDFDPAASWQQFVSQWERQVNELAKTFSGREEFAGPLNQLTQLTLAARQSFDDAAERTAVAMQLPTQAQMTGVIERLDRIEEQLQRINAALESQRPTGVAARVAPKRTKRPPSEPA